MIQNSNPFNDPEVRKQILKEEGKLDHYDVVENDIKSMVVNAPKIPKSASNIIMDANAIAKNAKDAKAKEMNLALNNIFTEYNKKYGTDLSINFDNMSQTLMDVANPEKRKVLELYVSEVFQSLKPIMLLHLISRLSLALDYILAPERLLDTNQLSIPDLFLVVEKLQTYIMNLTDILDSSAIVKDSDKILKKLADEKGDDDLKSEESKLAVDNFMALFKREKGITE
jgi:hypothetical protein